MDRLKTSLTVHTVHTIKICGGYYATKTHFLESLELILLLSLGGADHGDFMSSFSNTDAQPPPEKVPKFKFSLKQGWQLSITRLQEIKMVRSPSQYTTPGL